MGKVGKGVGLYKTETRDANQYTLQDLASIYNTDPLTVRTRLTDAGIKPTCLWDRPGKGRKPELYTDLMGNKFQDELGSVINKKRRARIPGKIATDRISPRTQGIILEAQIRLVSHLLDHARAGKVGEDLIEYMQSYLVNASQSLDLLRKTIAEGTAIAVDEVSVDASVNPLANITFDNTDAEVPGTGSSSILFERDLDADEDEEDDAEAEAGAGDQIVFEADADASDDDELEVYVF